MTKLRKALAAAVGVGSTIDIAGTATYRNARRAQAPVSRRSDWEQVGTYLGSAMKKQPKK